MNTESQQKSIGKGIFYEDFSIKNEFRYLESHIFSILTLFSYIGCWILMYFSTGFLMVYENRMING